MFLNKNQTWKQRQNLLKFVIISGILTFCFFVVPPAQSICWENNKIVSKSNIFSVQNKTIKLSRYNYSSKIMGGPLLASISSSNHPALFHPAIINHEIITQEKYPVDNGPVDLISTSNQIKEYIVKKGDTIEKIALKFNISPQTIFWNNHLSARSIIHSGDKLAILPINGIRIKIKSSDTVSKLAQKYHAKIDEIIKYNQLADINSIREGEYLLIPGGELKSIHHHSNPKIASGNWVAKTWQKITRYAGSMPKINSWLVLPTHGYDWGYLHYYNAIDIANHCGTPIHAAADGIVILSDSYGWNGGYGHYVKIRHPNGVITLYAHFQKIYVKKGQHIQQGEVIGQMGTTGHSTGCHLHFEVRGAKNPLVGREHWL
ncbi:MAG TPA: LysM peptidoglycan-binding domain-containing protein [Candidatus Portnoybacteria bacterium]|nr:LysM peptidoglycan-binding domain-containing protein [Candidatus Portnoybacteria bacterium]